MTHGKFDKGPFVFNRPQGLINSFSCMKNGRAYGLGRSYPIKDETDKYLVFAGEFENSII